MMMKLFNNSTNIQGLKFTFDFLLAIFACIWSIFISNIKKDEANRLQGIYIIN